MSSSATPTRRTAPTRRAASTPAAWRCWSTKRPQFGGLSMTGAAPLTADRDPNVSFKAVPGLTPEVLGAVQHRRGAPPERHVQQALGGILRMARLCQEQQRCGRRFPMTDATVMTEIARASLMVPMMCITPWQRVQAVSTCSGRPERGSGTVAFNGSPARAAAGRKPLPNTSDAGWPCARQAPRHQPTRAPFLSNTPARRGAGPQRPSARRRALAARGMPAGARRDAACWPCGGAV